MIPIMASEEDDERRDLDFSLHGDPRASPLVQKLRCFLFGFVLATCVSGLVIMVMGFWIKIELDIFIQFTDLYYEYTPYALVGIGIGIFFIGVLGCICVANQTGNFLYMFAVFLIIILIADIAVACVALTYRDRLETHFEVTMKRLVHNYNETPLNQNKMDKIQTHMKCCGKVSYIDWFTVDWSGAGVADRVPDTCCVEQTLRCGISPTSSSIHEHGCVFALTEFMGHSFMLIATVSICSAFLQLGGSILACGLATKIQKYRYHSVD